MNIQFTFKHMESSQALIDLASDKLTAKISRFTTQPLHSQVTFSVEGIRQRIHVSLATADGYPIEAESISDDMYAGLDIVAEKVERQLRKHKERLTDHKGLTHRERVSLLNDLQSGADDILDLGVPTIDAADILAAAKTEKASTVSNR
jgi:putative sigma-54 modulation protein